MKKIILLIVIIFFSTMQLSAQWKFESFSLSTGETPFTKGLTFSIAVSQKENFIIADLNAELGQILFFHSFSKSFSGGPTIGFFKNILWFAPVFSLNFFKGHLTTLNWGGWSFGDPEIKNISYGLKFLFSYQQMILTLGNLKGNNLKFSYALQHYQNLVPEHIFEIKMNYILSKNLSGFVVGGYMKVIEKYLWSMGFVYQF